MFTAFAIAAAAASKWLLAAKIMAATGGVLIAAQPVADAYKYRKEQAERE